MNKTVSFAKRNLMEMSRDALSYIFCVAFPVVMLIIMSLVNSTIPKESGNTVFQIDSLAGGVAVFGQSFIMLFTALQVATDRGSSFLIRLYASPMKSRNFTNGYILPMLVIALIQGVITHIAAYIISLIVGYDLNPLGLLLALVTALPSAVFFIALGLIFGTLFNEKSAPGMCSVIISLGSFLGGFFFDAEHATGAMGIICRSQPLYYCTKTVRSTIKMDFSWDAFGLPMLIVCGSAMVLIVLAIVLFKRKMHADLA
ncbi:MAG: ABC transporter permease [Eubacterium sp.]|nr:ABC transporter permease [Eubacterium sp.]